MGLDSNAKYSCYSVQLKYTHGITVEPPKVESLLECRVIRNSSKNLNNSNSNND